ncbi:MAG: hypothetical protein ACWIPI_00450, partial [Polaribacter sp.]
NEIQLYNARENVTYFLIGYQTDTFDYDKLFYENIEYFLQEYDVWEKIKTTGGVPNAFNNENYLNFTPENNTTFRSSQDNFGTTIASINWSYVGGYTVDDVKDYDDLKILTLNYNDGDTEEFELSVLDDNSIRLYNTGSKTTYDFVGRGFVPYLRAEKNTKEIVRNSGRKRTKIVRETKNRRN